MSESYIITNTIVLGIEFFICGLYLIYNYKDTIKHYHVQFWWTFILQVTSAVFLNDWLTVKHPYVYLNTSENDLEQGIIKVAGMPLSRSAILQFGVLLPLALHCFYAATKKVRATDKTKVRYDPSIKWVEYMISSSFQTLLLYSLYGQVGQTLWTAVGLKLFSMFSAYGFEQILIKDIPYQGSMRDVKKNQETYNKSYEKRKDEIINRLFEKSDLDKITDYDSKSEDVKKILDKILGERKTCDNKVLEIMKEQNTDFISKCVLTAPKTVFTIAFVIYFMFHYFPLVIYNDERPRWVNFFIAGLILNDASFPGTMLYFRNNLGGVRADIVYSIWSMISKNTFDIFLVLGAKRVSNWGIVALIPGSIVVGLVLYFILLKIEPVAKEDEFYPHRKQKRHKRSKSIYLNTTFRK